MFHVVRIAGGYGLPGVPGRVGCRNTKCSHKQAAPLRGAGPGRASRRACGTYGADPARHARPTLDNGHLALLNHWSHPKSVTTLIR